jgi:hypothetical protein
MSKKIFYLIFFSLLSFNTVFSQSAGSIETAKVYSRAAFTEWFGNTSSYGLKKVHSVVLNSWTFNSNTGRYVIIVEIKWEDSGFFTDDTYEDTFTLKCDADGCNANMKRDGGRVVELECIEK